MNPARSLSARLLVSVLLLLVIFFGLTIAALDLVFRNLSERALRELLDAQLVALIAASDIDDTGKLRPSQQLAEPRFEQPRSGLYAQIRSPRGEILWRSASMLGTQLDLPGTVAPGARRQARLRLSDSSEVMSLSAGFNWEITSGESRNFIFSVATSLAPYEAQLRRFRVQLLGWFLVLMVLLLVALAILLRRLLRPLREIEREIREVETGDRAQLSTLLPRELVGLAANLNALLSSERRRVERYRNTLGNLAHSLKTPLAVVRASLPEIGSDSKSALIDEQVGRMDAIVQYQLKRAAASGGPTVGQTAIDVNALLAELRPALMKVYSHKDFSIQIDAEPGVCFAGDRGDLLELCGNLLDNACKWCRGRVKVTARKQPHPSGRTLLLIVEDDGEGIAPTDRQRILERGIRLDEQTPGQGIGLSVVKEIVELYAGQIEIDASDLGGARISLLLPGR